VRQAVPPALKRFIWDIQSMVELEASEREVLLIGRDLMARLLASDDGLPAIFAGPGLATYPQGMEIDGFTVAALPEADRRCGEPQLRRRGPAFLRQNSRLYRLLSVTAPPELQRPELCLGAENAEDVARIASILHHFEARTDFSLAEVLAWLDTQPPA
jgi:spore coat polysaccharide biosynthesis protein SpsF